MRLESASFNRCVTKLGHEIGRYQSNGKHDAKRYDYEIVEIAEYRNEIRYKINGADRIGGNGQSDSLGMPRRSRVTSRYVEGNNVLLDSPRPLFRSLDHAASVARICDETTSGMCPEGRMARAAIDVRGTVDRDPLLPVHLPIVPPRTRPDEGAAGDYFGVSSVDGARGASSSARLAKNGMYR
jgi:hypothetical protein